MRISIIYNCAHCKYRSSRGCQDSATFVTWTWSLTSVDQHGRAPRKSSLLGDKSNFKPPRTLHRQTNPQRGTLSVRTIAIHSPSSLRCALTTHDFAHARPPSYRPVADFILADNGPYRKANRQEARWQDRPQRHRRCRRPRIHHPPAQASMLIQFSEVHRWLV
jgi:hypothetical protein